MRAARLITALYRARQAAVRLQYRARPEVKRRRAADHRHRTYGLTPEGWAWMLEQQGGACAMPHCAKDVTSVDHDPATGHVRALLCHTCNTHVMQVESAARAARGVRDYIEAFR